MSTTALTLGCISYYSYIKPQHDPNISDSERRCISYYSYIKPQLSHVETFLPISCISYYSYIKPQLFPLVNVVMVVVYRTIPTSNHNLLMVKWRTRRLYIVLFLHQTTTGFWGTFSCFGCISYYSYIKPQLSMTKSVLVTVVYRTIPTSNHNLQKVEWLWKKVVYRTIPTSNHNLWRFLAFSSALYIVLFLHQTTTLCSATL